MAMTKAERQKRWLDRLRARAARADVLEQICRKIVIGEPVNGEPYRYVAERYSAFVQEIRRVLEDSE